MENIEIENRWASTKKNALFFKKEVMFTEHMMLTSSSGVLALE